MSHCNVCWEQLQGNSIIAACGHVFCEGHAEQALDAAEGCTLCGGQMARGTIKKVPVEPSDAEIEVRNASRCLVMPRRREALTGPALLLGIPLSPAVRRPRCLVCAPTP